MAANINKSSLEHEVSFDVVQLLKPLFKELGRLPASLVLTEIEAVSSRDGQTTDRHKDTTVRQALRAWAENTEATRQPHAVAADMPRARPTQRQLIETIISNRAQQTRRPLSDVTVAIGNPRLTSNPPTQSASKRKADHLSDAPSSSSNSPNDIDSRPASNEHKRPRFTKLPPARRPERNDAWYSYATTPEKWAAMKPADKRKWSHIGLIEETEHGKLTPRPCYKCSGRSSPNMLTGKWEPLVCKTYKKSAVDVQVQGQYAWRCCSHCRSAGRHCPLDDKWREAKWEEEKAKMRASGEWDRIMSVFERPA